MDWDNFNNKEKDQEYYRKLLSFIDLEYKNERCFPSRDNIFKAMELVPYNDVKVVILGQDPYHGEGQAMGLSFSVPDKVKIPPSLRNIFKELQNEFGYSIPDTGDLTPWAKQGVLLLNSVLTVRSHSPASHAGRGWEIYTDHILEELNKKEDPVVFILWGRYARGKKEIVTNTRHLVLEAAHPSPFSANSGFFGCGHFKKCNDFLEMHGISPVDWQIR